MLSWFIKTYQDKIESESDRQRNMSKIGINGFNRNSKILLRTLIEKVLNNVLILDFTSYVYRKPR